MPDKFKSRSKQEELLDSDHIQEDLLMRNLRELDFLNRISGGNAISLEGIKRLVKDKNKRYHIVDLGCGSGSSLKYFARWAQKKRIKLKLTGVDKNKNIIKYLVGNCMKYPEIKGVTIGYQDFFNKSKKVDIFHCSLFCHHLNNEELIELLINMRTRTTTGFVINDLQRKPLAYYGAKLMTTILMGSSLSKHDGPVSVLRGFKKNELETLLHKAGVEKYSIFRRRGFRFLIVAKNLPDEMRKITR